MFGGYNFFALNSIKIGKNLFIVYEERLIDYNINKSKTLKKPVLFIVTNDISYISFRFTHNLK